MSITEIHIHTFNKTKDNKGTNVIFKIRAQGFLATNNLELKELKSQEHVSETSF